MPAARAIDLTVVNQPVLLTVIEYVAICVCAASGVLAARGKRIDLFGAIVLALATAFGGGTIRDVLAGVPVAWLRTPDYLLSATATALAAFLIASRRELPRTALLLVDALALALFTMSGTRKGLTLEFSSSVAVLLGVTTGVAGGTIRDILTGEVPLVFQPEIRLYATAACGCALTLVLLRGVGIPEPIPTFAGGAVTLALRLAGIRWRISLPILD